MLFFREGRTRFVDWFIGHGWRGCRFHQGLEFGRRKIVVNVFLAMTFVHVHLKKNVLVIKKVPNF